MKFIVADGHVALSKKEELKRLVDKKMSGLPTFTDWISFATSTFVLPLTEVLLTAVISSPDCKVVSLDAGVLSKI